MQGSDSDRRSARRVPRTPQVEAAKRDHRKLGAELNLFSIQESSGTEVYGRGPRGRVVYGT